MATKSARPFIRFETRAVPDLTKGRDDGGLMHYKDVDFIIIVPTGSGGRTVIENIWEEWLAKTRSAPGVNAAPGLDDMPGVQDDRFPWLQDTINAYKAWKEGAEVPLKGTSLKNWPVLTPSQLKMLLDLGIRTIEELADQPDGAIEFMGGITLRARAQTWVETSAKGSLNELTMKVEDERMRRQAAEERVAAMELEMAEIRGMLKAQQAVGTPATE